jgi:hypothetical protein
MTDKILTKHYEGTFAGGQGPILGMHSSSEPETKGGGEGKHIAFVNEGGHDSKPTGSDANFDLHGKGYAGPENWIPEDQGVKNPDDISSSFGVKGAD